MGLSVGAGVCVAHGIGAKEFDNTEKTVHTAIYTALIGGALVTAIGILFAPQLLDMIGIEQSIRPEAILYMRAYFCGMPAALLYNYCAAMLRASGDTARPLGFLTAEGAVDIGNEIGVRRCGVLGRVNAECICKSTANGIKRILIVHFKPPRQYRQVNDRRSDSNSRANSAQNA